MEQDLDSGSHLSEPGDRLDNGELTEPERFRLETRGRVLTDHWEIWEAWLRLRPVTMDEWKWLTARQALRNGSQTTAFISDWQEHNLM